MVYSTLIVIVVRDPKIQQAWWLLHSNLELLACLLRYMRTLCRGQLSSAISLLAHPHNGFLTSVHIGLPASELLLGKEGVKILKDESLMLLVGVGYPLGRL